MNRKLATSILTFLGAMSVYAQIVTSPNTSIATSSTTQIAFNNNITIRSGDVDLSNSTLTLLGLDQSIINGLSTKSMALKGFIVDGGGTKDMQGSWEISGQITLNNGIVVPNANNGKIVFTLPSAVAGDITVNGDLSYINGTFYSKGKGTRLFPIGNGSGYFPAQISSVDQVDVEVGLKVFNQSAALTPGEDIGEIFTGQYWELESSGPLSGAIISVSSLGASSFIDFVSGTVVLGAPSKGDVGESLGGELFNDFVVSNKPIKETDKIFTLGKVDSEIVEVTIHNVVTPFVDNANDFLYIKNIEIFPENSVRLLDRWGVLVKEWKKYSNSLAGVDHSYDLSKVSTGNYVCILEYKSGNKTKTVSQMITIINP